VSPLNSMPMFWRSPLLAVLATAGGALIGWWMWPMAASLVIAVLGVRYRGFPVILYHFLGTVGAVLGAATAFTAIISLGGWRRLAGWLLIAAAVGAIAWSAPAAWSFMRSDGRRLAAAVYGLPMFWACLLGAWSCSISRRHDRREAAQPVGPANR